MYTHIRHLRLLKISSSPRPRKRCLESRDASNARPCRPHDPGADVGGGEPSPGGDAGGSRPRGGEVACRLGSYVVRIAASKNPGAIVAGVRPVPVQMWRKPAVRRRGRVPFGQLRR